ncbi:gag-pol polyprotein [Tanacetum coccineum]
MKTLSSLGANLKNLDEVYPQHYLTEMQEVVLFYNRLDVPTRQILDSKGAIPSKTAADAKTRSTKTSDGLAAIQAQLNNLGREIKKVNEKVYDAQVGCEQCKGASVSVMPLLTYLNLGLGELAHTKLTVKLADRTVKYPKGIAKNVLVGIGNFVFPVDFIILDMLEDVKVPLILERPILSTVHAKIDVFKRKITLRVGEEKIIFKSVKPTSSLIKRVYMLSLRERMELDLEARLMGETLVLNRSLDPLFGDYIELNDLNIPLELRRDQVDDLMPTIEEGEVVEEFRARNDTRMEWAMLFSAKPFLREVGITERRFDEDYQFTNVSEKDMMRELLHSYQKLKGFYKGVLNLGPEYVRDAKMEEWLTRGHISVHEME